MGKKRTNTSKVNSWPDRVRALLAKYDLTQKQLGSRLGLSHQNISDFANGRRVPPSPVQKLIEMMEDGNDLSAYEKE